METCLAFRNLAESLALGLMFINLVPDSMHFLNAISVVCFPTPPAETCEFFRGIPPNITIKSHSFSKVFQVLCSSKKE